jgi:beta-lactamase class A
MSLMLTRRAALIGAACLLPVTRLNAASLTGDAALQDAEKKLAGLEKQYGGRLGVMVLDTESNAHFGRRIEERFAMCSSFKWLAAACVLKRVDDGQDRLDRKVSYGEKDLMSYAPETKKHVNEGGMALGDLCAAAVEWSDNTAANLVLASFGGPKALTQFLRASGDKVTRLDRNEPTLNTAVPGDPRDTTSPQAMVSNLRNLLLGNLLSDASRQQLTAWMAGSQTGDKRLRAGLPTGWREGDKTGTGAHATANTVSIIWPSKGAPILAAVYYTASSASRDQQDGVHAEVGRILAETFPHG